MAKNGEQKPAESAAPEPTVAVPVSVFDALQRRLESLELAERVRLEKAANPEANVLDQAYEAWKIEAARPAKERTQDVVWKKWGKVGPLWDVWLDSTTESGKPGPNISEHPRLTVPGVSNYEAEGRYLEIVGVTKHDYKLRCERVADSAAA